jgi:hypothetical protein
VRNSDLEEALSLERFGRYADWAGGDRDRAIELYTLNARLSESLYISLQMLEVALRNRIHTVMTEAHQEDWFQHQEFILGARQGEQLNKAMRDIEGREPTVGRLVAALTFGFWTAMFGKDYETLWRTTLHRIAQRPDEKPLTRRDFSGPLTRIRELRNRIAHHEPIVHWGDLPKLHAKIMELTGWLSPPAAEWSATYCRFRDVYPAEAIILRRPERRKPNDA